MTQRCLLAIDLLNDFLDHWDYEKVEALINNTNRLAAAFRERQCHVIWVRQEFRPDLSDAFLEMRDRKVSICIEGTRGADLHPHLDCRSDDSVIVKKRYSAFFRTGLDELLSQRGVGEITICGINTHACVRMAAIDAYQRDIRVIMAKECIGSYDSAHAEMSLAYMDGKIARLANIDEILAELRAVNDLPAALSIEA
ncbi:MAG: isochorismatase family cysteine hydrolase [Rhizobiaceae bacterium]|nr:isochorismatase family cysteine hydrolase [Rhizobiaceae bacterium]